MEIAHVLNIDVVEYSTLLITEQSRIMAELKRIVRSTARFLRAEAEGNLVRLPTGDGMALVFFHDPEAPIECAIEITAAMKTHPEIRLRMGIHSGPINEVIDVNERSNVAGAGIDIAQRVMDCGDAGHILLSKRVADDLAPYPKWNPYLHDLGECEVKHGRKVSLVNFYTDKAGNPTSPKKCRSTQSTAPPPRGQDDSLPSRKKKVIAAAVFLIFALLIGLWIFSRQLPKERASSVAPAANARAKSIAVLPFENLSHDPDNAYFADGIQEEILTRLSKIADLKVISRTSTQRYKSAPDNLREIARQLGVAHILEGSVQKAADQVRVNVQLINAENDSHLWAEKYDRKLIDIFAVESEIAKMIAETLQAKLSGAEQHAIATRPTENSEAHQAYLKGQYYWYKYPAPGFEKSLAYFQQAIDLDPTYALGYSGLAYYYGFAAANGLVPPDENWPKSEAAASKALMLDDSLADAYNAEAAVKLYYNRDWSAAERLFRRGIERNPNSAEIRHHYAVCLLLFGRNEEALAEMNRATELDPLALRNNFDRAKLFFTLRQFDRAIDQSRKTLELQDFAAVHEWLGNVYAQKGRLKEAVAEWSKSLSLSGDREHASILERTCTTAGAEVALHSLAQYRLEKLSERVRRGDYVPAAEYVMVCVQLGDKEQAFTWLAKAAEERNRFALTIKIDPLLDSLRGDPRFEKLANQIMPPSAK